MKKNTALRLCALLTQTPLTSELRDMAGSYGISVFSFLRDPVYFPSNFTDLHSYQQFTQSYSFLTSLGFSFGLFACLS